MQSLLGQLKKKKREFLLQQGLLTSAVPIVSVGYIAARKRESALVGHWAGDLECKNPKKDDKEPDDMDLGGNNSRAMHGGQQPLQLTPTQSSL